MDEEGFPLLSLDSNITSDHDTTHPDGPPFPHDDLPVRQDHESGEATAQQVVVFRRPPQVDRREVFPPRDGSLHTHYIRRSQRDCRQVLDESIQHRTFQIQMNFLCLCPAKDRKLRLPIRKFSECSGSLPLPLDSPGDVRTRQDKSKGRFRIPPRSSQTSRYKKENAMIISVWKELFLGASVFDYGSLEWKEIIRRFPYPYWLRRPLDTLSRHLPLCFLRLIHLLIIVLRLILRDICIMGLYSTRLYTHLKIHQIGQERGIQPVFTGKVYHGPITYGVRLQCTYCRQQQQARASLRYFQSLRDERQNAPAR